MKTIIIYTYYKSQSADYNLSFYVKKELSYKNNIDYIIVINGFNCDIKFFVIIDWTKNLFEINYILFFKLK